MTEPAAPTQRTEPTLDSATRTDPSNELATTALLRGAIGSVNTDYYVDMFSRFDAQDRAGLRWNTAAAVATLNWMLFRKMWNAALAYVGIALGVALLVFGIGDLALHYPPEVRWALTGLYALLLVLVPGFWGNALLFRQVRSDMAGALSAHQSIADAAALLLSRAPTRKRLIVLAVLNVLAAALVLTMVWWAKDFQGMSGSLTPAAGTVSAPAPGTVASGNLALGQPEAGAATPAATASSIAMAAAAGASAPTNPASAPAQPASSASAAAQTPQASAPLAATPPAPAASAPARAASAPANTASAPANGVNVKAAAAQTPATAPAAAPTPSKPAAPASTAKKTPPPSSAEKAEAAKLAPQATARTPRPAPATTTPPSAPAAKARPTPAPAATPDGAGVTAGQFGINVGVFADDNNARNAFVKLSDAGLPAYTQELRGKKGKLTRVRVGPFDSMAEAERTAARIRGMGLDALVFQQAGTAQ